MQRLMIATGAAALVLAGLAGCSSGKESTSGSTGSSQPATTSEHAAGHSAEHSAEHAPADAANAKVLIDGKDQNIGGTVACTSAAGQLSIAIGGAGSGVGAVLSDAEPPGVTSVALGNVDGTALGYTQGNGEGDAKVTKDGNKYQITGTATGVDMKNPMQVVTKSFEIDVTCP